jgi:uncharacterized protein
LIRIALSALDLYGVVMPRPEPMNDATFEFLVHDERLAIARLAPDAAVPSWARGRFLNIARTPTELSIVCAQADVPRDVVHERDKVAFGIVGTVPMTTIGILAALCSTLAAAQVPVFAISTYDTDYLLVSAERFETARAALIAAGHRFRAA